MIVEIWQLREFTVLNITDMVCHMSLKREKNSSEKWKFSFEKWKFFLLRRESFCLKSKNDVNFNLACLGTRPSPLDDTHVGRLSRLFSP